MAPQTKATFAHELQQEVGKLPRGEQERIQAACGASWGTIEAALPSSWIDEATFNQMNEAVRAELGDHQFRQLYRQVGRRLVKNPNFQKAVEALIRILGVNPHTMLKLSPRVRESLVKDSGTMTYKRVGDREAEMTIEGFPTSTWGLGTTAILLAGCMEGGVEVMGATPDVEIASLSLTGGGCCFKVRWS